MSCRHAQSDLANEIPERLFVLKADNQPSFASAQTQIAGLLVPGDHRGDLLALAVSQQRCSGDFQRSTLPLTGFDEGLHRFWQWLVFPRHRPEEMNGVR